MDDFHVSRLNGASGLAEVKRGNVNREVRTELGKGKVTFTLNDNRTQLWVTFRPEKAKLGESRWYHTLDANQFKLESVTNYDARSKVANSWDFFHSDEKYESNRMGVSMKGVCLFIAGLQADTKGQFDYSNAGDWAVEIVLKPHSRNMSMTSYTLFHSFLVLIIDSEILKEFSHDVADASKKKAAAEWAARQTTAKKGKKK